MMTRISARKYLVCSALILGVGACGGGDVTVGGTLSGLSDGLSVTLQNNTSDDRTLFANGDFQFATPVASGGNYSVTVLTQPAGQTCTVANGSGIVDTFFSDSVTSVAVTCVTTPVTTP